MMLVSFKLAEAPRHARKIAGVAACVLFAACSSSAIDAPGDDGDAPSAGTGGSEAAGGTSSGGTAPTTAVTEPDYRKQAYPPGPYGTGEGATLENFAFLGWRDPVAAQYDLARLEPVQLADFYNPDGRTNIRYLWINASAVWCSVCRAEMTDIKNNGINAEFQAKGVQLIGTLFEDNNSGPATPLDLKRWGEVPAHGIDFPLLLDPGFKLGVFFTSDATPLNLLVEASTMRVVNASMGYSPDYWQAVDELLAK
jgi:hypothetical protein